MKELEIKNLTDKEIEGLSFIHNVFYYIARAQSLQGKALKNNNDLLENDLIKLRDTLTNMFFNFSFENKIFDLNEPEFNRIVNYADLKIDPLIKTFEKEKEIITNIKKIHPEVSELLRSFLNRPQYNEKFQELENLPDNQLINYLCEFIESVLKKFKNALQKEIEVYKKIKGNSSIDQSIEENPEITDPIVRFLFLEELGILEHLDKKFKDIINNETQTGKIICQIMGVENISTIIRYVNDLKNNPKKLKTNKAMKKVNELLLHHKLIEIIKKR